MRKCLVILSGGQDSTTCLYWAKHVFDEVHAITFDYGQRHSVEIDCAIEVAQLAEVVTHSIVPVQGILKGTSPLVNPEEQVELYENAAVLPGGLEKTFVPMRNMLFLVIAANRAAVLGISDLVTGVCQEDFGGYPDCRQSFIDATEKAINEALFLDPTEANFHIHTPLMTLTKKESVELAQKFEGCMDALSSTHTCYNGEYPPCGHCHACLLRQRGFDEAGIKDPLMVRAFGEKA
jgi:7-cyano-7-deazaguanine synthase